MQVAVVGMGIAVPGASSPAEFWRLLNVGRPVFREPGDRYRLSSFWSADPDAEDRGYCRVSGFLTGFRPHPRLARELADGRFPRADKEAVLLRHCLLQATQAITVRANDQGRCIIGGTGLTSQHLDEAIVIEAVARNVGARLGGEQDKLRGLLRAHFGLVDAEPEELLPEEVARAALDGLLPGGCRATVVDTACSSSLYAIDLGARLLLTGDCQLALCGGMSGVTPRHNVAFAKLSGLSRHRRLRVFDKHADGTLFSDGAAIVALKTLERAVRDRDEVFGVLAGFGASSDGRSRSVVAASHSGQVLCIERARRAANLAAGQVDWVVAHGTGLPASDSAELMALETVRAARTCLCTSNKPVIGNTGWSAGAVSVVHALLGLRHNRIPAHRGLVNPPAAEGIEVTPRPLPWPERNGRLRTVGVSSFGLGGANGHLLIQEHVPALTAPPLPVDTDPVAVVAWAAHLPGKPDRRQVRRMLASGSRTGPREFGDYSLPPYEVTRLPGRTARAIDRGQLMALRVAAMLVGEYGELWAHVRDTTGVIATQAWPSPLAVRNLLRCYAADLDGALAGAEATALAEFLEENRARTPATTRDTLPGIMPSMLAARVAGRYDLHGMTMLADSGASALEIARLYLRTGVLDLALVLDVTVGGGWDGTVMAEGAYLVALTRVSVARRRGWRIHGAPLGTAATVTEVLRAACAAPPSG